jgi:FAD/FMN-containing dehydrogenase
MPFAPRADLHRAKVDAVARALRSHPRGRPVAFRKKAVSHVVPKRDDRRYTDEKIDLSSLDAILEIDREAMTCTVEPGVTFERLVRATLAVGLAPAVVPELKTITVGGAVAGCSLESMSFKVGGLHDTCLEYEVLTSRGEVLVCTPDNENRLVFQMIHGSFGTLGVLTKVKLRLVAARPYVRVSYERHPTLEGYAGAIAREFRASTGDFMDGILHAPDRHVLSLGRFVDGAPYTNRYDWVKVYWQSTSRRVEDYMRTFDYFFRYDHGVTNVHPRSALGRFFFGKLLHSGNVLKLAQRFRRVLLPETPDVTVDMFIPFSKLGDYMRWHDERLGFYPLWCVPYRRTRDYEWIADGYFDGVEDELFIDLAIYGMAQPAGRNVYREIEEKLLELRGIKTLISHNYYDEPTFWRVWDKPRYQAVKAITDPDGLLRDVYDKTCLAARGLDVGASAA